MEIAVNFVVAQFNALLDNYRIAKTWYSRRAVMSIISTDSQITFEGDNIEEYLCKVNGLLSNKSIEITDVSAAQGTFLNVLIKGHLSDGTCALRFVNQVVLDMTDAREYFVRNEVWCLFSDEPSKIRESVNVAPAAVSNTMTIPSTDQPADSKANITNSNDAKSVADVGQKMKPAHQGSGWAQVAAKAKDRSVVTDINRSQASKQLTDQSQADKAAPQAKQQLTKFDRRPIKCCVVTKTNGNVFTNDEAQNLIPAELQPAVIAMRNNSESKSLIFIDFAVENALEILKAKAHNVPGKPVVFEIARSK